SKMSQCKHPRLPRIEHPSQQKDVPRIVFHQKKPGGLASFFALATSRLGGMTSLNLTWLNQA
ncbi:MAG: hypothetical protein ABR921_06815, partial [Candidatus Sulfotelmatobacter sp.]